MRVTSAESTELFIGPTDAPLQLVRVSYTDCAEPKPIRVEGGGLTTPEPPLADPGTGVIDVPVAVDRPVIGQRRTARGWGMTPRRSFSRLPSPAGRCT